MDGASFPIADLHARNFVRAADEKLRVIDLVGGLWPTSAEQDALIGGRLAKMRIDPKVPASPMSPDSEF